MPNARKPAASRARAQAPKPPVEKPVDSGSEHVDKLHARIHELEGKLAENDEHMALDEMRKSGLDHKYGALRQFVVDHYGQAALDVFDTNYVP